MKLSLRLAIVVMACGGPSTAVFGSLVGPTPYRSQADSPFAGTAFVWGGLETFEDGQLNTPGLSASGGVVLASGSLIDSVDGDDGLVDGSGSGGRSWYSNGVREISFSFDAVALGGYPTHAGMVWTDVGFTDGTFCVGDVRFEAFDAGGMSLGQIGPVTLGDGAANGGSDEDRFFGAVHLGGISRITLAMPGSGDWELDHVQFGQVPGPATGVLLLIAPLAGRRRR